MMELAGLSPASPFPKIKHYSGLGLKFLNDGDLPSLGLQLPHSHGRAKLKQCTARVYPQAVAFQCGNAVQSPACPGPLGASPLCITFLFGKERC